jgi:endonuclease G
LGIEKKEKEMNNAQSQNDAESYGARSQPEFAISPAALREAMQARRRAAAFHLYNPRVVLIDFGLRIQEREGRRIINEPTVRVHVRYKPKGQAFETFAARNRNQVIDEDRIGFPIDIIEADYRLHWFWRSPWTRVVPPRAKVYDTLCGGISISNEWAATYGTLGGFVKDRATGQVMILSAWHVLAGSGYAASGLRIFQPGYGDGGRQQHTVARFTRHAMDFGIDAAVAELEGNRTVTSAQLELGQVTGMTTPIPGMKVIKSGRGTEVTSGIVDGVDGVTMVPYGMFPRTVRHVVHIAQAKPGDEVCAGGDSGSLWLEDSTKKAVALHFAGDDFPEYGLAAAMPQVLEALDVDLIGRGI